ncbi:TonB-dependent receptor [Hylemonella gracilis str. Niagara R]|uniref:TonB-dependent receptor n=1 Tax=Hylemonella gracilis str. Niagara R TaxID=1458275 RepID=A0A016XH11_9BURK|nr:TonB-dependent siderophore receptor [Hylemonella gracilis]EYC50483.1 TonB-dependent receptor [Hylemonella gracilis str. Niagara R]
MAYIKSRKHGQTTSPAPLRSNLIGAAVLATLALPAGAQTAESAGTLPSVTVRDTSTADYKTEELSSPKYTAPLVDTPQTITVLPARVLEEQGRQSLVEALSTVPGITFGAGEGGGGYGDSINFRGYSANNNITIDGMRDSAQYNRSDAFNLEQIEVSNGANSVYGGAGNVSGSINLLSKTPKAEDFVRASGTLGTDSYGRATLDANQRVGETSALRLNLMTHQNDVPGRDVEKYERWGVAASYAMGLGTPTQTTLSYFHQEDDNIPQYGVPYYKNAFHDGLLPGAKSSNYYGYKDVAAQEIQVDALTLQVEHRFSDAMSLRNQTRVQRVTQFTRVVPPQGTWCLSSGLTPTNTACGTPNTFTPGGPAGNTRDTENNYIGNQTDLTTRFKTGDIDHTIVTGVALTRETYNLRSGNSLRNADGTTPTFPSMSISDPAAHYGGPINFLVTGKTESELSNAAVYVFENAQLTPQWSVNGGARFEHNSGSVDVRSRANTTATTWTENPTAENSENLFSYRLGVVFKPAANGSVYAAYGNSQTPSQSTVNGGCNNTSTTGTQNCNVDPETAINIEVGTKWDVLENRLSLTASVFRNELQNFKVTSGDPTEPNQQTDGKSRVDGVALGAAGQVTQAWGLFANYTYLKGEVIQSVSDYTLSNGGVDNQKGDPLTNTPEHAASLWTTYRVLPEVTVGYGVTYQGSWYLNNGTGTQFKADGYTVQNAMVAYRFSRNLDFQLNVNNLTDELYYTRVRNNGWATPGDARSVRLAANYSF